MFLLLDWWKGVCFWGIGVFLQIRGPPKWCSFRLGCLFNQPHEAVTTVCVRQFMQKVHDCSVRYEVCRLPLEAACLEISMMALPMRARM